jgi:translation initiation factor 2 subunit 1
MSTTCTDKVAAIDLMEKAVAAIGSTIQSEKGDLVIKMAPKVVSDTDDAELKALMDQFEAANMDVAGDDDSDEE